MHQFAQDNAIVAKIVAGMVILVAVYAKTEFVWTVGVNHKKTPDWAFLFTKLPVKHDRQFPMRGTDKLVECCNVAHGISGTHQDLRIA